MLYYDGPDPHPTSGSLRRRLASCSTLACDVETVSLKDRTLLGIGIATSPDEAFYVTVDDPEFTTLAHAFLTNPYTLILHNAHFDLPLIQATIGGPPAFAYNVIDTLIAAQLIGLRPDLASLCLDLFGYLKPPITDLIGKGKNQKTMAEVPVQDVAERCCLDARMTYQVWEHIKPNVPKAALELELQVLPILIEVEKRGILVDQDRLALEIKKAETQVAFYGALAAREDVNPRSPKQVAAKLKERGHTLTYNYQTGNPVTNDDALRMYHWDDPLSHIILFARKCSHTLSWFEAIRDKHLQADGRIHANFHQTITDSGRVASSKPNMQNAEEPHRVVFVASPGNEAYSADFSQIEYRVLAWASGDSKLQQVYANPLGDIHTDTALRLNVPRRIAKNVNFSLLYGGDEHTMYTRYNIPLDQGKALLLDHRMTYRELWGWVDEQKEGVRRKGYIETLMGRRRYFPHAQSDWGKEAAKALREAINHPIQGSAAEIQKKAMVAWAKHPQTNNIHDDTWFDKPLGEVIGEPGALAPFDAPLKRKRGANFGEIYDA